jgi:hypothetical protein
MRQRREEGLSWTDQRPGMFGGGWIARSDLGLNCVVGLGWVCVERRLYGEFI